MTEETKTQPTEYSISEEPVSIREVYSLINAARSEIVAVVTRLETKFDNLEAGRLTTLELQHQRVVSEIEPVKKIVYGLVAAVLVTVVGAILGLVLIK